MKTKLIIDFDNTIVNSTKAFCETYNELFKSDPKFIPADWNKSNEYNFGDVCPLLESDQDKVYAIFENPLFFKKIRFIDEHTERVIKILNDKFETYICSIGTGKNIYHKYNWLKKNLPFLKHHVFVMHEGCTSDKSILNMDGAIFIDDHNGNLETSNASIKISFGKRYTWNYDWDGIVCDKWDDVLRKLLPKYKK